MSESFGELRRSTRSLVAILDETSTAESGGNVSATLLQELRGRLRQHYHCLLGRIGELLRHSEALQGPEMTVKRSKVEVLRSTIEEQAESLSHDRPLCPGLLRQFRIALLALSIMETTVPPDLLVNRIGRFFRG